MKHTFEALGTTWWIEIFDHETSADTLKVTFGSLERFVHAYEAAYSRFKPDSVISTLNKHRTVPEPTEACRALLTYGKELYLRSNTHFNLLTGHILEARGYNQDLTFTATAPESLTAGNPITDLLISIEEISLQYGNVDIGGFGKGYLIDLLAEQLRAVGFQYFLINGGGDMYATSEHGEPIEIYLEHPTKALHMVHRSTLLNEGFASSSPFKRVWQTKGKTYSHIVTDTDAPQVASYVKATTARDADAFATVALMLPETELLQLATNQHFKVARFSPATNTFWNMTAFDAV